MKKLFGKLMLASLIIMPLLLVVACSSDSTLDSENADSENEEENNNEQTNNDEEKSITVAINSDIQNFNPYTNQTVDYFIIRYNLFDSLVKFDPTMNIVSNLATDWNKVSDTEYTFTLEENVEFQNGQSFSAADVKYSIEMAQDEDNASFFAPYFADVESVVGDGNNVTIHLSQPNPALLSNLTSFPIIADGTLDELGSNPIGTGPFEFFSWSSGDKIELKKFENYWKGDTTNVDKVVLRPIVDSAVRLSNLISGTIDVVNSLSPNQMAELESEEDISLLQPVSSNQTALVEVVLKNNEAFQDPRVMQALTHALDKEAVKNNVYQGYGKVLWSPFPSNNFGYKEGVEYSFDLDKAKNLLEEAGYGSGLSFSLILPSGVSHLEQIAVMWQSNLNSIDVDMEINTMEVNSWVDQYIERSYEMTLNFYPQAGNDPSTYANQILLPLAQNSMVDPSQMVELIEKGASTADESTREEIYSEIQDLVNETGVIIPIVEMPIAAGVANHVSGLEFDPTSVLYLDKVQVE
ncbi:ABC transporter substrate-binding protein [Aquibacillus saliphilus]|uniref:ABC transporter substrate-binding protein n=1 Tax=Aquibacillus saliphilus TaxID=1909422 RepID=UPI001CF0B327|nr:ABC transporter substrate-binding protein [Aquibacillus saliphilus]